MITVDMHEAEGRLSELVQAVEERGERVTICRDGHPVAELHRAPHRSRLSADPSLRVILSPGYDPAEPLADDEIPPDYR
jgi:antitoxin (DNA-binding transcriptional repressor) of toxin-antitoxin stability system